MMKAHYLISILFLILYLPGCNTNIAVGSTPTISDEAPLTLKEAVIIGVWENNGNKYTINENHTFTYRVNGSEELKMNGQWKLLEDRHIQFSTSMRPDFTAKLQGDNFMVYESYKGISILRKLDDSGQPLPIEHNSIMQFPLFNTSHIIGFNINEYWGGYSFLSPSKAEFKIANKDGRFSGEANYSLSNQLTDTTYSVFTSITIPRQKAHSFLELLTQIPLINEIYQPLSTHTDDYPENEIVLLFEETVIKFYSNSQGQAHIPWRVTIDGKEYITYSENVMLAIELIEPFMARNIQKEMHDKADSFEDFESYDETLDDMDFASFNDWVPPAITSPQQQYTSSFSIAPEPIGGYDKLVRSIISAITMEANVKRMVPISVFINKNGVLTDWHITLGFPYFELNDEAIAILKQSKWKPAKQESNDVGVWITIPIKFEISKE